MTDRMAPADVAWLHMDRPTNLMIINSVLLFDEPIDVERVCDVIADRLVDRYPRFRQRVVERPLRLRPPVWVQDPDFALEHHVHHLALPAPGDQAALQALVADLMATPLDRNRPLWHTYLVDGYGEGAAIICRMHHCIADGVTLARVMLSLTDAEVDAGRGRPRASEPGARSVAGWTLDTVTGGLRLAVSAGRQGVAAVASPRHAARLAGTLARDSRTSLRLLLTPTDAVTAFKGEPRVSRRVAWTPPLPLGEIKDIAHGRGATVNDVLLAAVSGALRHYLQDRGGAVGEIQAMVPFNLRDPHGPLPRELGNRFGLVFLPLPVGTSDSLRRLTEVHRRMQDIKAGRDGPVSFGLLSATGMTPPPVERRIIDLFSAKSTAVITNVVGPAETVYLARTPVRGVLVWAPTSGHIGMSISIFSYCGEVTVGLMVDAALVPDPDEIASRIAQEVHVLRGLNHVRGRPQTRRTRRRRQPATVK